MLVSFSVENFRSFSDEETFSLVASKRLGGTHDNHLLPIPDSDECVLRTAVLYGANGAGKSNLFKALRYLKSVALKSGRKSGGMDRQVFRFSGSEKRESNFDVQFIANSKLYRFGFKIDDERITEEWLLEVQGTREKTIYERSTDPKGKVSIEAPGFKSMSDKLNALATVGGPQNQSFLATIYLTLDPSEFGEELNGIVSWFNDGLNLIPPDSPFLGLGNLLARDSEFNKFASDFLKSSSTGVDRLHVTKTEITENELRSLLPKSLLEKVFKDLAESETGVSVIQDAEQRSELLIEGRGEKKFFTISVQSMHDSGNGEQIPLDLKEESDGTRRLLNLLPAFHHRRKTAVFFIDEIDRSLHPILVHGFLEYFLKSCEGGQRQVIVTTHESNLLDLDLLRRDEIWFAEKDSESSTRLYSLADYKVRKDLEIRKHYLQGRFGAIPFLGNLKRLGCSE